MHSIKWNIVSTEETPIIIRLLIEQPIVIELLIEKPMRIGLIENPSSLGRWLIPGCFVLAVPLSDK